MNSYRLFKSMTPSGGAFLAGVGAGLIGFAATPAPGSYIFLMVAAVTGIVSCVLVAILSRFVFHLPKPSGMEMKLVWLPVVAEFVIFLLLSRFVPMDERTLWIVVLAIVGLHFLPMIWSYGPLIAMLGVACFGVALAGWFRRSRSAGSSASTER